MKSCFFGLATSVFLFMCAPSLRAQTVPTAPPLAIPLPDPFLFKSGARVQTPADWRRRRAEIRESLLATEYGHLPPAPGHVMVQSVASFTTNWGARQEHLVLSCGPRSGLSFELDLLLPADKTRSYPVILTGDAGQTPIPTEVVGRGFILAQFNRNQFAPDEAARTGGIYPLYPDFDGGALAAWAWGYARAVDYLLTRPDVDAKRIAIAGHSRGGKAVLLAGALDERVALTVANQSGSGGASPFRIGGKGSESLAKITGRFGYWFHPNLKKYVGREADLPFDQHFLLALVAPRALLLLNSLQDPYSNALAVQGSFLGARETFDFLGAGDKIGSHYREGGHSFGVDDWRVMLDFADGQFFGHASSTKFEGVPFPNVAAPFEWRAPHFSWSGAP